MKTKEPKQNVNEVVVLGTVEEALPNAMFKVRLDNESIITCTISGKIRMNHIRILPCDRVQVGVSIYDMGKGRILYREKTAR